MTVHEAWHDPSPLLLTSTLLSPPHVSLCHVGPVFPQEDESSTKADLSAHLLPCSSLQAWHTGPSIDTSIRSH